MNTSTPILQARVSRNVARHLAAGGLTLVELLAVLVVASERLRGWYVGSRLYGG